MGAALLKNPTKLVAILTSLVEEVGKPNNVPVSVKIRILDTQEETLALVQRLCATGIIRVTVHCRTTPMRPREAAIRDQLKAIVKVCHDAGVQCYANGDVQSRSHAEQVIDEFGVDGCMVATAAETNPSCFRSEGVLPWQEVAEEFLKTCMSVGNLTSNTKFCLLHLVPGKDKFYSEVTQCKSMETMCKVFGVAYNLPLGVTLPGETSARIVSKSAKKAQQTSQTVKAAGGSGSNRERKGKKLSERGVTAKRTPSPPPQRLVDVPEQQQATVAAAL